MKRRNKKEIRAALDSVVELVRKNSDQYLSPYEIAAWIIYACDRSDAMLFLTGEMDGVHPREDESEEENKKWTMEDELVEKKDRWRDDSDDAFYLIETQRLLAQRYDPDYRKPVLGQRDWLDEPKADPESAEVLKRVVDNAIDSSRRAARKRER